MPMTKKFVKTNVTSMPVWTFVSNMRMVMISRSKNSWSATKWKAPMATIITTTMEITTMDNKPKPKVLICIFHTMSVLCVLPMMERVSSLLPFSMQVAPVTLELVCTRPSTTVTLFLTKTNLLLPSMIVSLVYKSTKTMTTITTTIITAITNNISVVVFENQLKLCRYIMTHPAAHQKNHPEDLVLLPRPYYNACLLVMGQGWWTSNKIESYN
mmetsp:Transcript_18848/g.19112  ORF Transcript_18848/g.19112 Transcript_18848/m.19112 type:complete len:213 (+) Transcript_18848:200-838(+)